MPSDRTVVTELATGLGMLGYDRAEDALLRRPSEMATLTPADWDHLAELWIGGTYADEFAAGFANGKAFLTAPDALAGRRPRLVEWTGGRRPPGDEVVPSDLRVDHVYLVSCKYLSRILHNASPARLVEHLLAQGPVEDGRDWFWRTAPTEYQRLYERCRPLFGADLPAGVADLGVDHRRRLAEGLRDGWPPGAQDDYVAMCGAVAEATASAWQRRITPARVESVLWRLLRIGSAPYFILGSHQGGAMRLRIDTPWDWRQTYRLRRFDVAVQGGGQARVGWTAEYDDRAAGETRQVCGHIEVRWTHRRFAQPPEAKVYLDTPHNEVPGYHPLDEAAIPPIPDPPQAPEPDQLDL